MSTDQAVDPTPAAAPRRAQTIIAFLLVVVFGIMLTAANHSVWIARTALNEDTFVDTFGSLPEDPAVATAIGQAFAVRVVTNNDIEGRLTGILPDALDFLAPPLTEAAQGLIANTATRVVESDQFDRVWDGVLRVTHRIAIALVEGGERGLVESEDGQLVLDLTPLVEQVDERLTARGLDLFDPDTVDATVVIYDGEHLGAAQTLAEWLYRIRILSPIIVVLAAIGALVVASDRRRTGMWLGIATITSAFVVFIEMRWLRAQTIGQITDPTIKAGGEAAWSTIVNQLAVQTVVLLLIGLIVIGVLVFTGSSRRAVAARAAFTARRDAARAGEAVEPSFVSRNLRALQWTAVGIAVAVLLIAPSVTGWMVIVAALIVIAVVAVLEWIGGGVPDSTAST